MKHLAISLILFLLSVSSVSGADEQKKTFRATVGSGGVQTVEMLAGDYFFNPDHVIVKMNVPVELRIKKEPYMVPHEIVIHAPEAGIDIDESLSAEPKTIKFTPKKAGKYHFHCGKKLLFFKSHRDRGMEGVLEVVE